jgi:hypothetical protein
MNVPLMNNKEDRYGMEKKLNKERVGGSLEVLLSKEQHGENKRSAKLLFEQRCKLLEAAKHIGFA